MQLIRLLLARVCRLLSRGGLSWAEGFATLADRLEGKAPHDPCDDRGIGA